MRAQALKFARPESNRITAVRSHIALPTLINLIGLSYELQGVGEKHYRNGLSVEETNWEKWAGEPRPGDAAGAYSYEQLLRMDGDFTAALERAFAAGLESPLSARRIYVAKG
jgi:hypothetical protein